MRRHREKRKKGLRVLAHLLFALVVLIGIGIAWLAGNVRSLDFLKPYIQGAVSAAFAPFSAEAESIRYTVDTSDWTLVTGLQNLVLHDAKGHRVAAFSQVNLDLGLASLLGGSIRFETLEIVRPALHLTKQNDGQVTLSVAPQEVPEESKEASSADMPAEGVIGALKNLSVKTVVVRDALLTVDAQEEKAHYTLPRIVLMTKDRDNIFSVQYDVQVKEEEKSSRLTGSVDIDDEKQQISLSAALNDFTITLLSPFHRYGSYLSGAHMRLNGKAHLTSDFSGALQEAAVDIAVKNGTYENSQLFPEPLAVEALSVKAHQNKGDSALHIEKAEFTNADFTASAHGDITLGAEGVSADMQAEVSNLTIARIGAYWPPGVSNDARDWVTTYLTDGVVSKATATLKFTPEELNAEETPEGMLDADIAVTGATVGFLPGFDVVKGVDGNVKITARSLDIQASSGDFMRGTKLKAAHLRIPDFTASGIPMEFSLTLDATAPDVAEMIGPTRLDLASALKLDPAVITGKADGVVNFSLPLYSREWPEDKPYVTYDVTATLDNVSQHSVLGKWDIAGMNGELSVNNEKLLLETTTDLQDVSVELDIEREFAGKKTTRYTLVGDIPHQSMPRFGFTIPDEIEGMLGVNATVLETDASSVTTAKVGLSNATIKIDELNYYKMAGVPATITLKQEARGDQNMVPDFRYVSGGDSMTGSYTQDKKTGDFIDLNMSRIRLSANDFALRYKTGEAGRKLITLSGAVLDLSEPEDIAEGAKSQENPEAKKDENPLDSLLNSRIELNLAQLRMTKKHGFSSVQGVIDCGPVRCQYVKLDALTAAGSPFNAAIASENGIRTMTMRSDDAGGVIHAFDISDHVIGGVLDYKGTFDDSATQSVLKGRLLITDFRVVKGPILAKLLSLASLTGFLDTLSGNGIAFTKLSADAIFSGTTLQVKKGKAYGSSIGITVKGKIKPFMGTVDLEGTVVPAYAANSVIGKIPLLGTLLTGGEGEGFIAANYSMEGSGDDPDVMVNPLSLLTPGFLRNLFDVFDAPESHEEESAPSPVPDAPLETAPSVEEAPGGDESRRDFPKPRGR